MTRLHRFHIHVLQRVFQFASGGPLMLAMKYSNSIRQSVLFTFAADVDHFRPIEILIAHSEKVRQVVLGSNSVAGIARAVSDDAGDLARRSTQCHSTGYARSARESAGVGAMFVQRKSLVRILPNCIYSLCLVA